MFKFQPFLFALLLNQASAAVRGQSERQLSEESFLSYEPLTTVTDHAAIDLDQKVMEEELASGTPDGMQFARAVYEQGGHSKSFARLALSSPLQDSVGEGTEVVGMSDGGDEVRGTVMTEAQAGANTLDVQYATTGIQDSHVGCQVGGLPDERQNTERCLKASQGTITVGVQQGITYDSTENLNARTLQGFSLQAEEKMATYPTYKKFYAYYQAYDYGDKWVTAAFDGSKTAFANGNADFSVYEGEGLVEAIKKGSAYLNVWMYVNRELMDAVDDCTNGCSTEDCNDDQVHAWDEAVAFYTGSVPKSDPEGGYLLYTLAEKRCENFNTCMKSGNQAGMAAVNVDIFRHFLAGKQQLLQGNCDAARETVQEIENLMIVPLVQGTIRYAHIQDEQGRFGEKEEAEGASFAAGVLPILHDCSPEDAQLVYDNMKVGSGDSTNFEAVKAALERNYDCMGITCPHVGGLLQADAETYYEGAEPCGNGEVAGDPSSFSGATAYGFNLAIGLAAGAVALLV